MKQPLLVLSSAALLAFTTSVQAAGFDCKKASATIEKTICSSPSLDAADAELTQLYVEVRKALPKKAARQTLKQDQKAWLKQRLTDCDAKDSACLLKTYEARIATLKAMQEGEDTKSWGFDATIHDGLPILRFKLLGTQQDDTHNITGIEIKHAEGVQNINSYGGQKLDTQTLDLKDSGFVIEDVNFDDYKDIRLMEFMPAGPNVPYIYWLYDVEKKQFVHNKDFAELASPTFDAKTQLITMPWREGAMGTGENIYKVEDNKPVLIKQEVRHYLDEGGYTLTVKELKDGKMTTTEEKTVKE